MASTCQDKAIQMYTSSLGIIVPKAQGHLLHNVAFSRCHIYTPYISHGNNLFDSCVFEAL